MSLDAALENAFEGSAPALTNFYTLLLESDLFVLERKQDRPLANAAECPNEFLNVFAMQAKDRVIAPVFSSEAHILSWCGQPLRSRTMRGIDFLRVIPDEWWACLNPGLAIEKEFSPWEIGELRNGPAAITTVVAELLEQPESDISSFTAIAATEYTDLKEALVSFAESNAIVEKLALLKTQVVAEDEQHEQLCLLAETNEATSVSKIQNQLLEVARPFLIGDLPLRVLVSMQAQESMQAALLTQASPFYLRQKELPSIWSKLAKRLLGSSNSK